MKLKGLTGGFILACLFAAGAAAASPEDLFVMVVNVENEVTTLSRTEAELMFLSKKRSWPDGKTVNVIINETPKILTFFSHTILKRSPRQFLIFRKKMLFRGQGMPPPTVKTDKEVIDFVASHGGGLGYVSPEAVTLAVKVVHISL